MIEKNEYLILETHHLDYKCERSFLNLLVFSEKIINLLRNLNIILKIILITKELFLS